MKAVVMAGGEGSRLRPLTSRLPKPLLPVANRPVMEHILHLLARHGVTDVIATLHYLADEIEGYFGYGSAFGVNLRYVVEDQPLGTAGAVRQARDILGDEPFFVISGDALTDMDLSALLAYHRERRADATIALQRVATPLEFGVVVTDHDNRIVRFLEKPSWGEVFSDTINTGIYVLEPHVLDLMEPGKNYDFSRDIFPQLQRENKALFGYISDRYWTDIGTLDQYRQANHDALAGLVDVEPAGERTGEIVRDSGCTIDPTATITGPVVLGRDVWIGPNATIEGPAVLGNSTVVESGAHVARAILWNDVYVGADAVLDGCTIADRNTVKSRVTIGESAVLGRGCTIDDGATIRPHLRLWPGKYVARGAIVSMSLVYGMKWPGSLFGSLGVTGLANLELTPEFVLKLGQAFGSALRAGETVMTSRDEDPASRMMNRLIISGLLSVGINVQDLRSCPLPIARYTVRGGRARGGVHVRTSPGDPSSILIEFFDEMGINISTALERKIEGIFFREDFRRTGSEEVGILDFQPRIVEEYSNGFLSALKPHALEQAGFRVVVDYQYGNSALVLPRLFAALNVEMIALNAYFDPKKARRVAADGGVHFAQIGDIVRTVKANIGLSIGSDGEAFVLVDERGRIIEGMQLLALLTLLIARSKPGARIVMPVMVPDAIEEIATRNGASLFRISSDRRALRPLTAKEGIDFAGGANDEVLFPEFQPAFDGLYGAAKAMELIAAEGRPLSELVDMLPQWHTTQSAVACPWEQKGSVMRRLHDQFDAKDLELMDGIRVRREDGWVLVLPDAGEATVKLFAEGPTDEIAGRYLHELQESITSLVSG